MLVEEPKLSPVINKCAGICDRFLPAPAEKLSHAYTLLDLPARMYGTLVHILQ